LKPTSLAIVIPKLTAPSPALVVLRGCHARRNEGRTDSATNVGKVEGPVAIVMPRQQRV